MNTSTPHHEQEVGTGVQFQFMKKGLTILCFTKFAANTATIARVQVSDMPIGLHAADLVKNVSSNRTYQYDGKNNESVQHLTTP
jgi:hypothetical protein